MNASHYDWCVRVIAMITDFWNIMKWRLEKKISFWFDKCLWEKCLAINYPRDQLNAKEKSEKLINEQS